MCGYSVTELMLTLVNISETAYNDAAAGVVQLKVAGIIGAEI